MAPAVMAPVPVITYQDQGHGADRRDGLLTLTRIFLVIDLNTRSNNNRSADLPPMSGHMFGAARRMYV